MLGINWFDGREEPSFNQLYLLAQYFNCEPNWLKHNEGVPFKKSMFRFTEDIESNAKQLLEGYAESDEYVKKVWFARNNSQAGELIIVKHFDSWRGEILKTNVHVSDIVGSSGMRDRALMSLTLKYLCKHHIIKTHGAIVSEEQYSQLLWAKENPLKTLEKFRNNTWVEDIWDEQMYLEQGDTYWQGWQQLCVDNANYIHNHDRLSKILL